MTIQQNVENVNKLVRHLADNRKLEKKVLAVAVEMNQRYVEYLDELEGSDLSISNGVDVEVNGQVIHFKSVDDFSAWLAEGGNG